MPQPNITRHYVDLNMLLQKAPFICRALLIKDAAFGYMAAARIICLDTKGWLQPLLPQGSLEGSVHCLASLCSKGKSSELLKLCGITDLGLLSLNLFYSELLQNESPENV